MLNTPLTVALLKSSSSINSGSNRGVPPPLKMPSVLFPLVWHRHLIRLILPHYFLLRTPTSTESSQKMTFDRLA